MLHKIGPRLATFGVDDCLWRIGADLRYSVEARELAGPEPACPSTAIDFLFPGWKLYTAGRLEKRFQKRSEPSGVDATLAEPPWPWPRVM
jgi:hypothetical protein